MKKRLLITITVILALAVCVGIFAGCTESLKQDAIPTDTGKPVSGNGGMTVVYGDYLYFINGFAGQEADNKFGDVVKGAIARVELKDGVPTGDPKIIVPKNVYGSDTTYGGIYISGDYIYYQTTSTELDGNGKAKSGECVIMRTKVDGTDTKEVVKLDSHSVVFKVAGSKLVYIYGNALYSVDLNSKKFNVSTIESSILTGYIMDDEYIYYNVNFNGNSSNNELRAYPLAGGEAKTIVNSEIFEKTNVQYTFGILSVINEGDNVRIFYSKTDDTPNNPEQGIYSLVCDKATFTYNKDNEKAITKNSSSTTNLAYTKFYKVADYYLGLASTKLDAFNADGTRVMKGDVIESINVGNTVTVFDIEETDSAVYMWYRDSSSVLHKIQILTKSGSDWKFVEGNETKIFSGNVDSTYVEMEKVGNVLYYFNGNISKNAYYYVIDGEKPADGKEKILGIITEADIIAAF